MTVNERSLRRYALAIERRWMEFLGRPAVLSPSDWRWISEWHERGIPLELIVDCLDAAEERRRAGRGAKRPRGLSYLAAAVDESWSVILDGRVSQEVREVSGASREPPEAWRRRLEQEPSGSPLQALLAVLLADLEAGTDAERVDEALESSLHESVPPALREAAEAEARSWLESHRSSMSPEEFENAVQRAAVVRLRRRLQLPRLAH